MPAKQEQHEQQDEGKKKAPAGGQPGRTRRNQSRAMSKHIPSADPHRSVARARKPRASSGRTGRTADAPLRVVVEIELTAERDPMWNALWRWLLSDSDESITSFLRRGAVEEAYRDAS